MDVFLHVPKTGGTTLNDILRRQFPRPGHLLRTWNLDAEAAARKFLALPPTERARVRLISGHTPFGVHALIHRPASYFTLLRDPVERAISHFFYLRATPHNPRHAEAAGLTLEEFVLSGRFPESGNEQAHLLSGLPYDAPDDLVLARARANMASHFRVVGLMEEFDASLLLLQRALGWRPPYYVRRNVTRARPARAQLGADTLALIRDCTALDHALYADAAVRFRAAVEREGPDFAADLARFGRVNREYQAIDAHMIRLRRPFGVARRALAGLLTRGPGRPPC